MADQQVEVWVEIDGEDIRAGELWAHRRANKESATFSYDREYIALPAAYAIDPSLPLVSGPQQTDKDHKIFGVFGDCAPDRWGRRLIARSERRRPETENRTERSLGEIDYLLGSRDDMRQGALRFRRPGESTFLADERTGVPTLVAMPKLLAAADRLERNEAVDDDLRALVRGGSSLGGARPKAHVIDADGRAAIAKFPSPKNDDWDVMRWEAVALELAREAGMRTPRSQLLEVAGRAALIVDRFDRVGGRRLGYMSAMTLLEATDGQTRSYLEIVEALETESASPKADMHELWRRVAFSILISNTDDHLRNHGLLRRSTAGWSLSPAFDINPNPEPGTKHLNTAIEFEETEARIETLLGVAAYFDLGEQQAMMILREVYDATGHWRSVAAAKGLSEAAVNGMRPAFEHEQRQSAARLLNAAAAAS